MTRGGKRGKLKPRVSPSFHRAWKSSRKRWISTFPQRRRRLLHRHNFQTTPPEAGARADEELKAELYQQIGKLQVERDWLKKSPDSRVGGTAGMDRSGERQAELGAAVRAGRSLALGAVLSGAGGERGELEADAFAGRAVHAHAVLWGAANELVAGYNAPRSFARLETIFLKLNLLSGERL